MLKHLNVKFVEIDWQAKTLTVTDAKNQKHIISLNTSISVAMTGYPEWQQKTMPAHQLGKYREQGYIIEQISYDDPLAILEFDEFLKILGKEDTPDGKPF